jgi:hypothetical protein
MPKANQQLVLQAKVERPYWRITVKIGNIWRTSMTGRQDEIADHVAKLMRAGHADTIKLVAISEAAYVKGRRNA